MLVAFITHFKPFTSFHHIPARKFPSCSLDPSRPVQPSRNLSATDRKYLAKIKAKFLSSKRAAAATAAARGGDFDSASDDSIPIVPEDLDEMEDVLYDRGPKNVGQAKLFGGWLDEAIAGRKAGKETISYKYNIDNNDDDEKEKIMEEADCLFSNAMNIFGRGMYREAVKLFAKASHLVGPESRLGGQYQLWQAQALDAAGNKKEATQLFGTLSTHKDSEVRKVSRELLFILTAPKLQLNQNSFMQIPDIDDAKSVATPSLLNMSNFSTLRTAMVEKPPEPHSLQWYLEKEKPQKIADHSIAQAVAIAAAIVGTLAFMAVSPL